MAGLPIDDRYQSLEWKLRRFVGRWDDARVVRHLRWMSSVDLPELAAAVPAARGLPPATLGARLPPGDDWLNQILALDFTTYMSGSVLTKVDRASMAHGLEVRPPLLDDALVDFAFSLPSRYQAAGAPEQVPAQARGARADPGRGDRSPEEGIRDSAGRLAARAALPAAGRR